MVNRLGPTQLPRYKPFRFAPKFRTLSFFPQTTQNAEAEAIAPIGSNLASIKT
ncbi:hypothetical protein SLEP1_g54208 [Rubroshorea leprosula]|uniref:Uncharacterized protein n=1 Tax=Rubroshorea leprosula TaxID=152421 RepID=A0AAV5MCM4_9ROSI|nr:hypothetical protein SLEP1_g54208 [Rubroshorea leprosula]